jgi:aminopeptidase N
MRWFDDLWLKEGFAQYTAYRTLTTLTPEQNVWKRFYQQIKPGAYGIDVTKGTTPIYQDIPNLKDAKSAYGAIVYSKAPGLLRQLDFVLGENAFRDGLRLYLKEHAYGNAEWSDLVHAFERTSGRPLSQWADAWIRHRGMPEVDVAWSCDNQNRIASLSLSQHDVLNEGGVWPISTQVLLGYQKGSPIHLRANLTDKTAPIAEAVGKPCPAYVFANDQDYAYGRFMLDEKSKAYILAQLGDVQDLFQRTLLWGALWDAVREAQLDPKEYLSATLTFLPGEKDEALVQSLGMHGTVALHRYVGESTRQQLVPRFEDMAIDHMLNSPQQGVRIMWFRTLRSIAGSPRGLGELKDLLADKASIPGVELRPLDRWSVLATLVA